MTTTRHAVEAANSDKQRKRASASALIGTALEYFDFQLYGLAAALVFNHLFFPNLSPAMGLLSSFGTYAIGFLARPVGALFFGRLGDKHGRKLVLIVTIAMMGGATTLIGLLPTYSQIGIFAPILLVLLRLVQGFGAGAEMAGAAVLLSEFARPEKRGVMASLAAFGTNTGTLAAAGCWALMTWLMPNDLLMAWGWRIPFVGSLLVLIGALLIRSRLSETPIFLESREQSDPVQKTPVADLFRYGRRPFLICLGLRIGESGCSYLIQAFLIGYLTTTLAMSKSVGTTALLIASVLGFGSVIVAGKLSDLYGRRIVYRWSSGFMMVGAVPGWAAIQTGNPVLITIVIVVAMNAGVLTLFAVQNSYLPELFGNRYRYTGLSLSKEIGAIFAGGLAPIVASGLLSWFANSWLPIALYMALLAGVSFVTTFFAPETAGRDLALPENATDVPEQVWHRALPRTEESLR